jgi:hypothetical protein
MANVQVGLREANANRECGLWRRSASFDPVWRECTLLVADMIAWSRTGKGETNAQGKGSKTQEMHDENEYLGRCQVERWCGQVDSIYIRPYPGSVFHTSRYISPFAPVGSLSTTYRPMMSTTPQLFTVTGSCRPDRQLQHPGLAGRLLGGGWCLILTMSSSWRPMQKVPDPASYRVLRSDRCFVTDSAW